VPAILADNYLMPKSSTPRKAYRPKRFPPLEFPTVFMAREAFAPLRLALERLLATGETAIDARGVPIFTSWDGDDFDLPLSLEAWAGCWERVNARMGTKAPAAGLRTVSKTLAFSDLRSAPTAGLRALAEALRADVVSEADLQNALADLDAQQALFLRLPRKELADIMQTEESAIYVEQLGLTHAGG